jgi:hypothetical protein
VQTKNLIKKIAGLNEAEKKDFDTFLKFRFKYKKFSAMTENELNEIEKQIEFIQNNFSKK